MALQLKDEYEKLNQTVKQGLNDFMRVGNALAKIKNKKLFRQGSYDSFDDYCQGEHGFGKSRGYRMIKAAEIAEKHPEITNERVARSLSSVSEEHRSEVLAIAKEKQLPTTASVIDDVIKNFSGMNEPVQKVEILPLEDRPSPELFNECLSDLRSALATVKKLVELPGGKFLQMRYQQIQADIKNAGIAIKHSLPTVQCRACNGRGCKICFSTGWVPTEVFDRTQQEMEQLTQ